MADYIEFTVNVNENQASDSESVINNKIKNNSDKSDETKKLENQARENMSENNPTESGGINTKAIKAYIKTNIVKNAADTSIKLAEAYASQQLLYSGNTAMMNKFNNKISGIKAGVSSVSNIATSTAAGAALGPYGAIAGAILGVVNEAIDLMVNYNTKRAQIEWNLETDRLTGHMAMNRLGLASAVRGRVAFNEFKM